MSWNGSDTETIKASFAVASLLATKPMITARDAHAAILAAGRDVSLRTTQRILQSMCEAGVLVQARPINQGKPIQFSLAGERK